MKISLIHTLALVFTSVTVATKNGQPPNIDPTKKAIPSEPFTTIKYVAEYETIIKNQLKIRELHSSTSKRTEQDKTPSSLGSFTATPPSEGFPETPWYIQKLMALTPEKIPPENILNPEEFNNDNDQPPVITGIFFPGVNNGRGG